MGNVIEKQILDIVPDKNNVVRINVNASDAYKMEQVQKFIFENDLVLDENGYYLFDEEYIHIVIE